MFIKYSTGQISPKKIRGRGSLGKKTINVSQETVDVSEESEPEPAKKRTANNALELGKSISITKAKEEEAARQVHATHARIVTESVTEPAKKKTSSKSTRSVVIQDTPSVPKPKPATSKPKLKGVQSLTLKNKKLHLLCKLSKKARKPT
uniref:Uncharacterized protein n=1 Tax=Tanacetum cinerariifolium TaxID=118510 RepID=A0A699KIU7_TANCI|nr:hypothetical protein [Tanacetum cinerariifolium]